jgi:hypothetical protein
MRVGQGRENSLPDIVPIIERTNEKRKIKIISLRSIQIGIFYVFLHHQQIL